MLMKMNSFVAMVHGIARFFNPYLKLITAKVPLIYQKDFIKDNSKS